MSRAEVKAAKCVGKEQYVNADLAHKVLARRSRSQSGLNVYRCQFCGFWHHGRKAK